MATTVILEVPVQPGKTDELISTFNEILPDTRSFKGCQSVTVHRDTTNPDTLLLIEHWDSAEDHAAYSEWRKNSGTLGPLMALAAGRPATRILDDVG